MQAENISQYDQISVVSEYFFEIVHLFSEMRFASCELPDESAGDYRSRISWMSAFYFLNSYHPQILFIA
jgi:hypothetical protein